MQSEKRKNKHDDDDQTDEVDYSIHDTPPTKGTFGQQWTTAQQIIHSHNRSHCLEVPLQIARVMKFHWLRRLTVHRFIEMVQRTGPAMERKKFWASEQPTLQGDSNHTLRWNLISPLPVSFASGS